MNIERNDFSHKPSALAMAELQTLRSSIQEISSLADRLEERISYLENKLALHSKSGLPSHYRMESELQTFFDEQNAADEKIKFTLLIIQLEDSFSMIRKTFPNSVNDWILFQIGARISDILQPGDRIFHTMDHEFILTIQHLRGNSLRIFLKMLFDVIEETHVFSGFNLKVTARGGASFYPEHGTGKGDLLQQADLALGTSMQEKKRFVLFNQELLHQMVDKADLQNSILKGLESPLAASMNKQFIMHYQPKLFMEREPDGTYRVRKVEAEALLRWDHPSRGMVPPARFIPLAEETGLILPLGKWTFFQVAEDLAHWHNNAMAEVGISINLSARQFRSDDIVDILSSLISTRGISPESWTLELTETSVFEEPEHAADLMKQFKALGVKLSVDDFGTGYSSLSLLHRFPLDEIKIDRLFVENIQNNPHDQSIVRSLVALASEMKLAILAEGVDSVAVLDTLYDTGCRGFQGWLIAKAMSAAEFESFYLALAANGFRFNPRTDTWGE